MPLKLVGQATSEFHLLAGMLGQEDWEMHRPRAYGFVVAAKMEGSGGLLQGDLLRKESKLLQMVHVPAKRSKAHQRRRSTRIHHSTVRPLSSMLVLQHDHAILGVIQAACGDTFTCLSLAGTVWSSSWNRLVGSLSALHCSIGGPVQLVLDLSDHEASSEG